MSVMINKTHWPKRGPLDVALVNILHHSLVVSAVK